MKVRGLKMKKNYSKKGIFVRVATFIFLLYFSIDFIYIHFNHEIIASIGIFLSFYSTLHTLDELFDFRFRNYFKRKVLEDEKNV